MTDTNSPIRFDVSNTDPNFPIASIEASTRYQESRVAIAVVATLRDHGVPVRDIVVVARNLDSYEDLLAQAAIRHGITPVFWKQIELIETTPYQLVAAVCELFGTPEPDGGVLLRPLELGWTPQETTDNWPVSVEVLREVCHRLPEDSRPLDAWQSLIEEATWIDRRVLEYVEWVACAPDPTPTAIDSVLGGVVESYRERALPERKETDSPALLQTETAARATVRMETLVEQVESKYKQRLADGWADESWTTIQGICESLARQRPGRREHANARALDILEANDIWARKVPYVVAVGLIDGEWPSHVESEIPPELQHTILVGDGDIDRLAPQTAWYDGRDYDQFFDTIAAATRGIVVTRHKHDIDGSQTAWSPLLRHLDAIPIGRTARKQLLSTDRDLPGPIASMLPDDSSVTPEGDVNE